MTGHRLWKVEEDPHLFWLIINWALKFPAITRHTKIPLENPEGVEIKSWGCWETTMKAISTRKDTTWHRSQELKKKDDVIGHWLRINIDDLVSGCQTGLSTCESTCLLCSLWQMLPVFFFCFCCVKFLNGLRSTWGLLGKHEWPCSIGRLYRIQAQRTHTLIRFCKAPGERWGCK